MLQCGDQWRLRNGDAVVYIDQQEHIDAILRTLRIDGDCWRNVLNEYGAILPSGSESEQVKLDALTAAYARYCPYRLELLPSDGATECPMCGRRAVIGVVHRSPGLLYGCCQSCGHGILLAGAAEASVYGTADYYSRQDASGAGYPMYLAERQYRETRGRQILEGFFEPMPRRPLRVLEVGSGFGYTRQAARELGCESFGVDLNPHAAERAQELYGFETAVGDLATAVSTHQINPNSCDFVLYQFVLEHVADPIAELRTAWSILIGGGYLGLLVPSMEAAERGVFGASYRSLRADHLHLFSRESLDRCLRASNFEWAFAETRCSVDLLLGFLGRRDLNRLYERGAGPDWIVLAKKRETS